MLRRTALVGLLVAALAPASAHAAVSLVRVGNFSHPVYVTAPPGDTHRLLVVEQGGTIREEVDGTPQAVAFLDISGEVTSEAGFGEQGLLSMAFAPDYATSGRFYVYYTSRDCPSSPGCDEHVSEFTRSASNPNVADPSSEHVLLTIPHPSDDHHNGGQLQFGPDGDLYISTGDGGGGNDAQHNAQNQANLLGKILRISPGPTSYSIPATNPSAGNPDCHTGTGGGGNCPEIWAYGLRNPWRFSFDRLTGDMVIGDVGQSAWEEIDFAHPGQNAGANYGWPCFEGDDTNAAADATECLGVTTGNTVAPVWEYAHSCTTTPAFCGAGIIGGYVVRDSSIPELYGRYIYGDLSASASKGLRSIALGQPSASDDASIPVNVAGLSSFGEDAAGCVYASSVSSGWVYRIAPAGATAVGPCPITTPPAPTGRDTTPAALKIMRSRGQHVLRTHYVRITVSPNELATITARGTVSIPKAARAYRLHTTTRQCFGGKKVTLRLRVSKKTLAKIRRGLRHRKFIDAKITVTSKDASSNVSKPKHAMVRLLR
jgi:glucose/arabinose dehydrogenase